ncbi:glycosyltransferase family 2 protein [Pseudomonas fluorescens]|uniref:Cell wall biosynthesis glycosyltransferase n=1 Tax=Pseudomonas fluorescens TaxID=294 RepID=A0A423M6P8_PSEFL|nr:glycosyltransferase family 2 protein [Pseudomonas fluorescens]RON77842.1 cell wall biosynthesis glycosyltransferase [Pseudomonas fluorescens]
MNKVWIVIAAYNEASVISRVVEDVRLVFENVVVVDDGSSDETYSELKKTGAWCIAHPINLGQGAALQTGIEFAIKNDAEYIVTFDADGQHSIQDVVGMLNLIKTGDIDVVLGSRFLGNAVGITKFRRVFLKCAAFFTGVVSGVWLTDAHNGLRVFTVNAARQIKIRQNRMSHASEIIDIIGACRLVVKEYPVTITYTEYSIAKGQKLSNSFSILLEQLSSKFIR